MEGQKSNKFCDFCLLSHTPYLEYVATIGEDYFDGWIMLFFEIHLLSKADEKVYAL